MNSYATEVIVYERMHDMRSAVAQEQRLDRGHPSRTLLAVVRRLFAPLLHSAQRHAAIPRAPRPNPSGRSG